MHRLFCFALFCKSDPNTGAGALDVSETFVVECDEGGTISVQGLLDFCVVECFSDARFVVFSLQSEP